MKLLIAVDVTDGKGIIKIDTEVKMFGVALKGSSEIEGDLNEILIQIADEETNTLTRVLRQIGIKEEVVAKVVKCATKNLKEGGK